MRAGSTLIHPIVSLWLWFIDHVLSNTGFFKELENTFAAPWSRDAFREWLKKELKAATNFPGNYRKVKNGKDNEQLFSEAIGHCYEWYGFCFCNPYFKVVAEPVGFGVDVRLTTPVKSGPFFRDFLFGYVDTLHNDDMDTLEDLDYSSTFESKKLNNDKNTIKGVLYGLLSLVNEPCLARLQFFSWSDADATTTDALAAEFLKRFKVKNFDKKKDERHRVYLTCSDNVPSEPIRPGDRVWIRYKFGDYCLSPQERKELCFCPNPDHLPRVRGALPADSARGSVAPAAAPVAAAPETADTKTDHSTDHGPAPLAPMKPSQPRRRDNVALVAGTAFLNQRAFDDGRRNERVNTSNAPCRDRLRLLQLRSLGFDPVSCSKDKAEKDCEPWQHIQAAWTARGASAVGKALRSPVQYLMLDYFRFPGVYMRTHYGTLLGSMLPALVRKGIVDEFTFCYLPNLGGLLDGIDKLPGIQLVSRKGIPARMNPLSVATDRVPQADLAYSNTGELEQLDKHWPFVCCRFREDPAIVAKRAAGKANKSKRKSAAPANAAGDGKDAKRDIDGDVDMPASGGGGGVAAGKYPHHPSREGDRFQARLPDFRPSDNARQRRLLEGGRERRMSVSQPLFASAAAWKAALPPRL